MQYRLSTVGFNIYYWGRKQQNRLLSECIAPAIRGLNQRGLLQRFWYDRINSRGPHIFLLTSVESNLLQHVRQTLTHNLTAYLQTHPSDENLTLDEVQYFHADMGGKVFCVADSYSGLGENNTFEVFEQGETQYPFMPINSADSTQSLWHIIRALYLWSLKCLETLDSACLERVAAVFALQCNRICFTERESASDYWKYHAGTLLKGLDRMQLDSSSLAAVLARLTGAGNAALLRHYQQIIASVPASELNGHSDSALAAISESVGPLQDLQRYLGSVQTSGTAQLQKDAKVALREILHTMFKQFGLRVPQHIPLVLFLWSANLNSEYEYSISRAESN